jgi:glucose/arabinose dehydrogenase
MLRLARFLRFHSPRPLRSAADSFAAGSFAGALLASSAAASVVSQGSEFALRFYGADVGQSDRIRIQIDDDEDRANLSEPIDLGAASLTVEFWVRGTVAENPTLHAGGDLELLDDSWNGGNHVVDRDVAGATGRRWGISIAGGFVRFGTGTGEDDLDLEHTLEGDVNVLDGEWHHVACVRDKPSGVKSIYVDGQLDFASSPGRSTGNLSFPNQGAPGQGSPWGHWLFLAARKHNGPSGGGGSFTGYLDELRLWRVARSAAEIAATYSKVIDYDSQDLVGYYRFEEGLGTLVNDSSVAESRAGFLSAGVPGEGEWVSRLSDPANVAPVTESTLPNGFARTLLASALAEPTVLVCAADGRVFIGQRGGAIRVYDGGLLPQPVLQLDTDTLEGERGLVGLALDPQFATNGWIYAHFTTPEPRQRVSRFTVSGNQADPQSEFVVWQNPSIAATFHHGGGMVFGADQMLYIATGDQFAPLHSQDLSNQHGKLLRLASDGSIPLDNPLLGTPGADPAVWAWGLRNPFRMALDPQTGALWIGDVGGNDQEAWEELNLAAPAVNYGWPDQEGGECSIADCGSMTPAFWGYRHDDPNFAPDASQACVILGAVYRGATFPAAYQGNIFVADYANRWIRRIVLDAQGAVASTPIFMAAPHAGSIVDLEVGADGALYYLTIGYQHSGGVDVASLQRIDYVGANNLAPVPQAQAAPLAGLAPLAVQFSSAGTLDPDQGPGALELHWDFGDGSTSDEADPLHVYAADGPYSAVLTVGDGELSVAAPALEVRVGNAPTATIDTPAAGATFCPGSTIAFSGSGFDPDDGALAPAQLTWRVFLVHEDHVHPAYGPISGTGGSFVVPLEPHALGAVHYRIRLEVADSSGLTAVEELDVLPPFRTYCTSSLSTNGCVARIGASGSPSASAAVGFILRAAGIEGQKSALFFYGASGAIAAPWGSGGTSFRCVRSPVQRTTSLNSGGTAGGCDGAIQLDWNSYRAARPNALGSPFVPGQTLWAQAWFRDPPAVKGTNMSDALEFSLCP